MLDAGSARLSSTYFGGNPANLGAVGGLESHQLTTAQLASHTHVNTLADSGHTHTWGPAGSQANVGGTGASGTTAQYGTTSNPTGSNNQAPMTISNVAAGGGGSHNNVQPTIILNKLLRVL
jgi:microcystin-dependent protein